ncbi:hypothetical protein EHQ24_17930 [Leptospira noumeaensis]|uniref:Uncharacterized protein n=1 Tax=Leptospira noumeaensis TaxID=2484964 RepID=A0A4R9I0N2_9LEPT|nr:hypothetical protein [Leptospira noumeaensis]TGK78429.1 hypothetical protein EHQ24_17930 [Leptospira noumeaensis]
MRLFKKIISKLMRPFLREVIEKQYQLIEKIENFHISLGELQSRLNVNSENRTFSNSGFKVFSQWDEDGLIDHIINRIPEIPKSFIEFGVENYSESNTRYLMMSRHWEGMVIDGSKSNIEYIRQQNYFWQNSLRAVNAFITKDNINSLIKDQGFSGNIGILSVDIDGNDYWVWKQIESVSPVLVITEINNSFGAEKKISIPYDSGFQRFNAHYSGLYYGASLPAFIDLANQKGYKFIGCNNICNNAFFIRNDFAERFSERSASEVYLPNPARESRNEKRELTYVTGISNQIKIISDLPVFNFETNSIEKIGSVLKN